VKVNVKESFKINKEQIMLAKINSSEQKKNVMLNKSKLKEIKGERMYIQRDQQELKLLAANDRKIFPKYEIFLCVSVGTRCNL
jgi:hypothetical protein